MTIGERIKELRKARGITQVQLAKIIGIEQSSVGKYEGKDAISPSDDIKIRIADYFGVSLDYLVGRDKPNDLQLSPAESKLISDFRTLSPEGKEYIKQQMAIACNIYIQRDTIPDVENHAG